MSADIDSGAGLTMTFGTSGWTAELTRITADGISRGFTESTHYGTTQANGTTTIGGKTFFPHAFADPGSTTVEVHFNPDTIPPVNAAAETITFAFEKSGGDTTGASWAVSGFISDFSADFEMDGKMTATLTLKHSGLVTITAGS